jgi:hypothetical protein
VHCKCLLLTQSGHTDSGTFLPLAIDRDHRPILADGKTLDVAQNLLSSNTQHVRSCRFKCLCISATLPFRFIFLRRSLAFGLSLLDHMIASASGLHRKIFVRKRAFALDVSTLTSTIRVHCAVHHKKNVGENALVSDEKSEPKPRCNRPASSNSSRKSGDVAPAIVGS